MSSTTTPISTFSQAIKGGNDPNQDTSTLKGFYDAPLPLFRAMNQQTVTDIQVLSDGKVGTFLQRRRLVNGDVATIVNATLDYFLGDKVKNLPSISPSVSRSNAKRTFIPIIIKTDFKFDTATNQIANAVKTPLYIIFDSTPQDISFSKAANWVPKEFLGRPEPVWTYNNSGPTTFSLTGKFFADSFEAHGRLLKVSDYIMSLVTPSKRNYMPSPVTVFIGEWKQLRCIVNNVQIKYEGPWTVRPDKADIDMVSSDPESAGALSESISRNIDSTVPSHAPYMFEATFSFTMVGQDNHVKYAEQVISSGSNNSSSVIDLKDPGLESALQALSGITSTSANVSVTGYNTGLYSLDTENKYTYSANGIVQKISADLTYTEAAKNLNLYEHANTQRRLADRGVISNAISSQMLKLYQKANPSSTNSQASSSSLNPFRKLF